MQINLPCQAGNCINENHKFIYECVYVKQCPAGLPILVAVAAVRLPSSVLFDHKFGKHKLLVQIIFP